MKGIINIEFFLSVAVFISTIFFIINSITSGIPQFHNEALLSSLRARLYGASQILVFDEGSPRNWHNPPIPISQVNRIGLSTSTKYVVNQSKITRLATFCGTDYITVRNIMIGSENLVVIINITNIETGAQLLYCSPTTATLAFPKASVTRYAVLDTTRDRISIRVDAT